MNWLKNELRKPFLDWSSWLHVVIAVVVLTVLYVVFD